MRLKGAGPTITLSTPSPIVEDPNSSSTPSIELQDDSRGRVAFECADLTLAVIKHAVGAIPVGGPPLKATLGGLQKLMEAGDVSSNA